MKKYILLSTLFWVANSYSQPNYIKSISSYYGDENMIVRDSQSDSQGNFVLVGEIKLSSSIQFNIATLGSHQTIYGGGVSDCFITKFDSNGTILWATYFGGEAEDRLSSFTIDKNDNIILLGTTISSTNIATPNSFQPIKSGIVDHFITKINPIGEIVWSTYFGGNDTNNQNTIEETEDFWGYPTITTNKSSEDIFFTTKTYTPNMATVGVFQETPGNNMIVKFSRDGQKEWATFYGVNSSNCISIQSDNLGVYVLGRTSDCPPMASYNTYFATLNCQQPLPGSCKDLYLSKFNVIDGTREWSTYIGGTGSEIGFKKSITISDNHIYVAGVTNSNNNISTPNSFQPTKNSGSAIFILKYTTEGVKEWGTYYGNPNFNTSNTIDYCGLTFYNNNLFVNGLTYLNGEFTTPNSFQENFAGAADGFLLKFNTAGERQWATYFGGTSYDLVERSLFNGDAIYLIGNTKSTQGISTTNGLQPNFLFNNNPTIFSPSNIFITKLEPNPLSTSQNTLEIFSIYPNPNNGVFSISLPNAENATLEVYDVLGKLIHQQTISNNQQIELKDVSKGIYFAKVYSGENVVQTQKIIIN